MKQRLNLLSQHKKYLTYQQYFLIIKKISFVTSGLFFIVLLISFIFFFEKKRQIDGLIGKKEEINMYIKKNIKIETNYKIFSKLFTQLKINLNNDVDFYPQYNLINESIKIASVPPTIDSLSITNDKKVNFTLSFNNFDEMLSFFNYVEKEEFLKNFINLTLKSFSVESDILNVEKPVYKLTFNGQFKIVNHEN